MTQPEAVNLVAGEVRGPIIAGLKSGGGGGSRTRVRERVPVGLYMRIRFFFLMPGVRKRLKTARHQSRFISRSDAETPSDCQPV